MEIFNQIIKKMFNKSNFKHAALTVATFWSMKSARAMRQGRACQWYEDRAVAAGELSTEICEMSKQSDAISAASQQLTLVAACPLYSVVAHMHSAHIHQTQ